MNYGTVYLTSRCAPGGTDRHQGYLRVTASGVFVHLDNINGRADHYYPSCQVQRVSYR